MTSASTDAARAALLALRAESARRVEALGGDVAVIIDAASSTTGDDEHDPEGATVGFERAQAMALLAQARGRLAEIDAALARLDDGSYGRCVSCGAPIPAARLEARPEATRCVTCAGRRS